MNYEKFNDAMCRLRQAEEALNKAFQNVYDVITKDSTDKVRRDMFDATVYASLVTLRANKEKSDTLCIGDEIEYIKYGKSSEKRIVIRIDDREGDEKIIWTIGLDRFDQYGTSTKDPTEKYRKTGKHYDSIPLNTKSK